MSIIPDINTRVVSACAGSSQAAVDQEILASLRDLCSRTGIWHDRTEQDLTPTPTYTITPPTGAEISMVSSVRVSDKVYQPWSETDSAYTQPDYTFSFGMDDLTLTIAPTPTVTVTNGLQLKVRCMPIGLTGIPNRILKLYEETIVSGALSRMYLTPDRAYTNPALAKIHAGKFAAGAARARRAVLTGHSRAAVPWTFPLATQSRTRRW